MRLGVLAAFFTLLSSAIAVPELIKVRRDTPSNSTCLEQSDAESIVSKFTIILAHSDPHAANVTAEELLDDSFSESSDSFNMISGAPVSLRHSWLTAPG